MRRLEFKESAFPLYDYECTTRIGEYGLADQGDGWRFYPPTGDFSKPFHAKEAAIEAAQKDYEERCMALCGYLEWVTRDNGDEIAIGIYRYYVIFNGGHFDVVANNLELGTFPEEKKAKEAANRHHKMEWLKQSTL